MRRGFGLAWALLTLAVVGVAAWFAYGAGGAQGTASVPPGNAGGGAVYPGPYYYHYGWGGWGFGFFPFFLFILLLFLLFWRPWRWRHRHGYYGYGHGPWGHHEPGQLPPPVDDHLRAWHDRAHGNPPPADQPPQPG